MSGRAEAVAEVRRLVAGSGSSFLAGMRVLPARRRAAIFALYAFCRVVDDIADGPGTTASRLARIDDWSDEIERIYRGRPESPVGQELARAVERYRLPRTEFELILDGMRIDIAERIVAPEFDALERYVRRVAGAVGVLSMHIFGAWRDETSRRFALSLAHGIQIINILRDVPEDAAMGRLYLPRPILAAAGIPADPAAAARHPNLPEVHRRMGAIARASLRAAAAEVRGHSRLRLLPALLMMGPYERLLSRMEADWTRPPPPRPGWMKMLDAAHCAARGGRIR